VRPRQFAAIFLRRVVYLTRVWRSDLAAPLYRGLQALRISGVQICGVVRVEGAHVEHLPGAEVYVVTWIEISTGETRRDRVIASPR